MGVRREYVAKLRGRLCVASGLVIAHRLDDAALGHGFLPVDALGVDPEQNLLKSGLWATSSPSKFGGLWELGLWTLLGGPAVLARLNHGPAST